MDQTALRDNDLPAEFLSRHRLEHDRLCAAYGGRAALDTVSCDLSQSFFHSLLGSPACGIAHLDRWARILFHTAIRSVPAAGLVYVGLYPSVPLVELDLHLRVHPGA
jgi:hypothetical protein